MTSSNPQGAANFVHEILAVDQGRIIACNILAGIEERLFDVDQVKSYFDWWMALCEFLQVKTVDAKLAAMDHLINLPPGFGQVRFLLDKRVGDAVTFAFTAGAVRSA